MNNLLKLTAALLLAGGFFVSAANLPLAAPSLLTAVLVTTVCLLSLLLVLGKKGVNKAAVKSHLPLLVISGLLLGAGGVLTLVALTLTAVSSVKLCLFAAPLLVTLLTPLVLREKLSSARLLCLVTSATGAVLISAFTLEGQTHYVGGIVAALAAMLCFAIALVLNKKTARVPTKESAFYQLLVAAVVVTAYACAKGLPPAVITTDMLFWLMITAAVHGVAVSLLFVGALSKLSMQKTALFCYVAPAAATMLDVVVFGNPLTTWQIIGLILIGGSTVISEFISKKK